jgi:hypothetical protein
MKLKLIEPLREFAHQHGIVPAQMKPNSAAKV